VFDWAVKVSKDGRSWQIGTICPEDQSWLVSALWDDTWTCIGRPHTLIEASDDRADGASTEANPGMPECYRDT
jgi:hypothetical protein